MVSKIQKKHKTSQGYKNSRQMKKNVMYGLEMNKKHKNNKGRKYHVR